MVRFSSQISFFSLLLLFSIICNLGLCELKANSCNEEDKQILLCFKHSLIDPSGMLSTWSTKEDCCKWRGVQCDISGRVTDISLPCSTDDDYVYGSNDNKKHCLAGEIHPSLLDLEFLNHLDLSNNNFKSINWSLGCQNFSLVKSSHESGNSSNLVLLDWSGNEMLVIDDLRWLLRLPSLQYLYLSSIDLHKETQWLHILTKLPSLSKLSLFSCQLNSASPSIDYANFTSLEYLDLSNNDFFSELPNWLFNLSGLSYMILGQNRFHGQIPNTLLNLKNLHTLILSENMLSGKIPDWLGQFENLHSLSLAYNLFNGSIPANLGNLSSLRTFEASSNHLTGSLPESFGQLFNLELLSVEGSSLSGAVSHRNFANLSNLQILNLGSPSLVFDFDPHWTPPFQLYDLTLLYVDLKLLPWLYTQRSLDTLVLQYSLLELEPQEKFWSWAANIQFLSLSNNLMPNWDMSNVLLNSEVIWLVDNGLSGGLPQLTPNVRVFQIEMNNLSGSLSPLLCHKMNRRRQNNLQYLDIGKNLLSEGIPDCWENWKSLLHVDLGGNNLTGMIPHSMSTLSNLLFLELEDNNLHGQIPSSLKNCQKLMILSLSENKLSGSIPNWIGQNVRALKLRSNEFSGNIPLQFCQLSSLSVLDLANNRLTGTLPNCLHNITTMVFNNVATTDNQFGFVVGDVGVQFAFSLELLTKGNKYDYLRYMHVVDLSSNQLFGKIPPEVFKLTALQSLNLSHNQLMGTIPDEIGNMKQLESLDFSNNKLSGEIPQSMSSLSFLGALNLSFNNLTGRIPLGTQLQGFTALCYIGNPQLCGTPLTKNCTHDEPSPDTKVVGNFEKGSDDELLEGLYIGMGTGFTISFWVVCGSLFFNRTWRHAYFKFLYDLKDQIYVKMVLKCTPSVQF